jgi:hypothetical protein
MAAWRRALLKCAMSAPGTAQPTAILIAASSSLLDRLRPVLEGHRLVHAQHMDEALRRFNAEEFGMVIVGVHFDESQMFELLERLRSTGRKPSVPIVCMLPAQHALSPVFLKGLDHAVKALMANAFLDLRNFPDDDASNARLRRIIDYLILINGDMHQGLDAG